MDIKKIIRTIKRKQIRLKGKNIILTPIQRDDAEIMIKWRNENLHYFFDQKPLTLESHLKWFDEYSKKDDDIMFIVRLQNGTPIGYVSLYNISNDCGEFGRFLIGRKEFRGKGLANKIIEVMLDFAFNRLKLKNIRLNLFADNERAKRLYEKWGFIKTREMYFSRNGQKWDMTSKDMKEKRIVLEMTLTSERWLNLKKSR